MKKRIMRQVSRVQEGTVDRLVVQDVLQGRERESRVKSNGLKNEHYG
jgi:hypothetical protein